MTTKVKGMQRGARTPWGKAQDVRELASGVWLVDTAGHGGIKLDRTRQRAIPEDARREGGWYEEDVDACIPLLALYPEIGSSVRESREGLTESLARYNATALRALVAAGHAPLTARAQAIMAEEAATAAKYEAARASGTPLRCSALGLDSDCVHVLFRAPDATETVGFYMTPETYDAVPLGVPATADDYRAHGALTPAPSSFGGGQ